MAEFYCLVIKVVVILEDYFGTRVQIVEDGSRTLVTTGGSTGALVLKSDNGRERKKNPGYFK